VTRLVRALAFVLLWAGASAIPDAPPAYEEHLGRISRSVLPVRAVLKIHATFSGQTADLEDETETTGVVVDASGTMLVSNTALGGTGSPIFQVLSQRMPGIEIRADITRLVVLVGEVHEEREATLLVRDSMRDIAWIRVKDAKEKPLPAIDLADSPSLAAGQRLLAVTRLARGFDYAPDLARLYVTSSIRTPRPLFGVQGDLSGIDGLGHLAFDLTGRPVGALITQVGVGSGEDASIRMFLLPLDGVRASLKSALALGK
jgi:hypothetical protein